MHTFWSIFYLFLIIGKYNTMKVTEIITEFTSWNDVQDARLKAKAAAGAVKLSEADIKKALQGKIEPPKGMTQADLVKQFKIYSSKNKSLANDAKWFSRATTATFGGFLIKIMGAAYVTNILRLNLESAEQDYFNKLSPEDYQRLRQAFIGEWMVQIFIPFLASAVLTSKWVLGVSRLLIGILTLGTGIFAGPMALAGIVIEQAAFTGLQYFLQSDTFRNWAAEHLAIFTILGYFPERAWNELRGFISKYVPGMDNPGMTADENEAEKKKKANPAAAASDEAEKKSAKDAMDVIDKKSVFVKGSRVTDAEGNLDPIAFVSQPVQWAIQNTPNDPNVKKMLALPRVPGGNYTPIKFA
jgi:hypothetical protein